MNKRIPLFLGLILVCLAVWLLLTPAKFVRSFIERLDSLGYDLQLRTRVLTETNIPTTPVAIIDIDDKSLDAEGRWPWPRVKLGQLVSELQKQGAAVIAFDMLFSESEPNVAENLLTELKQKNILTPLIVASLQKNSQFLQGDVVFANSLKKISAVLALGLLPNTQKQNQLPIPLLTLTPKENKELTIIKAQGFISNIPVLQQAAAGSGFINIFPDSDGIIRHAPLIMQYENQLYPALSLQAVLVFLGTNISLITPTYHHVQQLEGIRIGEREIPTDATGQVLIPFIGKNYTFPYYSATDVLHHTVPKDALLGKILFIGTSATGLGDLKATAIQNPFAGVEVQATLANGLLTGNFSYKPAWTLGANIFITILLGLIAAFLFPYFGPRLLSVIIIFLPPILLFINSLIWKKTGLILSLLMPCILVLFIALLNLIYGYLFETRRRERLKEMFGQYVPPKHIDEMLQSESDFALKGQDREMTVLFADIRNFTSISENMSAAELVEMLNIFFTPMTEIIFKHRGTIDKYIGDLIMAFWGAPLKDKHHARHAIQSALEMQAKIKAMRPMFAERNWPDIKIGIGINSGIMSVGDMGSRFRRNYTVLGDAVNLSSRIESLTKFYGVDIIVSEHTERHQNKFVFRKLDIVKVKGKNLGVTIYEVICKSEKLTPELAQELELYHQAYQLYLQQQWDASYQIMEQLHEAHPHKKLYKIYLERITEFKQHPVPENWDGIYVHASK